MDTVKKRNGRDRLSDETCLSSLRYSLDSLDLGQWETGEEEAVSSPSAGRISDQSSDGEETFISGKRLLDSMLDVVKKERFSEAAEMAGAAYTKGRPGDEAVDAIESGYDPVDGSMPKADGLEDDDGLYKLEDDVSLGTFLHASVLLLVCLLSHHTTHNNISQSSDEVGGGGDNSTPGKRPLLMAEEIQTQLDSYLRSFDETVETIQNWEMRKAEIKRELDEICGDGN